MNATSFLESLGESVFFWGAVNQKMKLRVCRMRVISSETGASMLEYALLAALIFAAAVGAVVYLGERNAVNLSQVGSAMQ